VSSSEAIKRSAAERLAAAPTELTADEQLAVEARTHRRTALVALRGELDLLTVSKGAEVLDGLELTAGGVRHLVLDLRGLTFMDIPGLRELIKQTEFARTHHHGLAVVRGTDAINRLLKVTGVEDDLGLVDDPDDLVAPPMAD
jgi:anti-sigma B factor antagonist